MTEITQYLQAIREGKQGASDSLLNAVYETLRQIAAARLSRESGQQTLHPTDLVHEAWIRMGGNDAVAWENRSHFFGAAAEAMRRTLVDNARKRKRLKRGGPEAKFFPLVDHEPITIPIEDELLDVNEALSQFEIIEPLKAQVVKLKFFGGMTISEIASITELADATVERYWAYARAWMQRYMDQNDQ